MSPILVAPVDTVLASNDHQSVQLLGISRRASEPDEDFDLSLRQHLVGRVDDAFSSADGELKTEDFRYYVAYMDGRYLRCERAYRRLGRRYARTFTILTVSAIAGGVIASGIAAGWNDATWARMSILIFGLVAAGSVVGIQLWKPAQQAARFTRSAEELKGQGWTFVTGVGPYATESDLSALRRFVVEVERIINETDNAVATDITGVTPSRSEARSPGD
jgi:hypothetical protein